MPRHQLTTPERQRGGNTTAAKSGGTCPRCKKYYAKHLQLIGHKGLHTFADRYTGGDLRAAAKKFNLIGAAATDPYPSNGAFARAHQAAEEVRAMQEAL